MLFCGIPHSLKMIIQLQFYVELIENSLINFQVTISYKTISLQVQVKWKIAQDFKFLILNAVIIIDHYCQES